MKNKPMFAETTDVPVQKSVGDIVGLLMAAGAVSIHQDIQHGSTVGLSFVIPVGNGVSLPYALPVRVEAAFKKLQQNRTYTKLGSDRADRERAERICWRQLYWWLKAQLALIDLQMAEISEVLLPYRLGQNGKTFYETFKAKLLVAPDAGAAVEGK